MPFGGALSLGLGVGGSIFSGLFGASAAQQAEQEYLNALKKAQGSLLNTEQQGLNTYSPWLTAGGAATGTLAQMLGTPGQGLLTPWTTTFTAPTAEQAAATPGYQFQLQQGEQAVQNSAAARGGLLSGQTLADMNNYAQGVASTNYQNVFNNSLTQYESAYNTFLNNQNNTYSRLMGLSGSGLSAAQGSAGLISGIGGDIASLYGAQGAAQAQGTLGAASAYSSILPGIGNSLLNYGLLSNMGLFGGNTSSTGGVPDTASIDSALPLSSLGFTSTLPSWLNPTPTPPGSAVAAPGQG